MERARDWKWSSYRVYSEGEYNPIIDILPSFEGLSAKKKVAAKMFREMVDGVVGGKDEVWSKSLVIGEKAFVTDILDKFGMNKADKGG